MKYKKKGSIKENLNGVIALVTGVGIAVMVFIFVGTLGGRTFQLVESDIDALTGSVVNESFTPLNSTVVNLANRDVINGTLTVANASSVSVGLDNFNVNYEAGTLELTNATLNNTAWRASYNYGAAAEKAAIKNSILSSFESLQQVGDYMPLIVLIFIISFVLVLVMGLTNGGKGGSYKGSAL